MKYSILLALFAIVGTLAVVGFASPQRAAAPNGDYQASCVALTAELALFKSGMLQQQQMLECTARIKYHVGILEKFKP